MMKNLEMCQKSLNEYLDMKRKFIHASILSRQLPCWTYCQMETIHHIMSHLVIATNLKTLLWDENADDDQFVATGVQAQDGEIIEFYR